MINDLMNNITADQMVIKSYKDLIIVYVRKDRHSGEIELTLNKTIKTSVTNKKKYNEVSICRNM